MEEWTIICCFSNALHAEEQQATKKEKTKVKTDRKLQLALVQAVSRPGGSPQQTGGGRYSNWAEGNSEMGLLGLWSGGSCDQKMYQMQTV